MRFISGQLSDGLTMNERIQALVKQAGDYVNEVYTPPVRSKTPGKIWEDGHIDWHTQFNKKFAELIIQECIGIALKSGSVTNKSEQAKAEADRIYHKIQEHFGVE